MGDRIARIALAVLLIVAVSTFLFFGLRSGVRHEVETGRWFAEFCLEGHHDCVRACAARFKNRPEARVSCLDMVVVVTPND